jgi:hypothetical protein
MERYNQVRQRLLTALSLTKITGFKMNRLYFVMKISECNNLLRLIPSFFIEPGVMLTGEVSLKIFAKTVDKFTISAHAQNDTERSINIDGMYIFGWL